jgi:hypothetical protein
MKTFPRCSPFKPSPTLLHAFRNRHQACAGSSQGVSYALDVHHVLFTLPSSGPLSSSTPSRSIYPLPITCPPCKIRPPPLQAYTTDPLLPKARLHPRFQVPALPRSTRTTRPPTAPSSRTCCSIFHPCRTRSNSQQLHFFHLSDALCRPIWSALVKSPLVRLDRKLRECHPHSPRAHLHLNQHLRAVHTHTTVTTRLDAHRSTQTNNAARNRRLRRRNDNTRQHVSTRASPSHVCQDSAARPPKAPPRTSVLHSYVPRCATHAVPMQEEMPSCLRRRRSCDIRVAPVATL